MLSKSSSTEPTSRAQATAPFLPTDVTTAGTSPPTSATSASTFSGGPAASPESTRRSDPRYPCRASYSSSVWRSAALAARWRRPSRVVQTSYPAV